MSAIPAFLKQIPADARNFVPISSLAYPGGINSLNATNGQLATAAWAGGGRQPSDTANNGNSVAVSGSRYTSSINGPGAGKLRDMGKTYVSASRVFRKVQLIVPVSTTNQSTFGVEGNQNTTPTVDYLTGYIELGWEGSGIPAPVARAP
jgi:hypothetical protein